MKILILIALIYVGFGMIAFMMTYGINSQRRRVKWYQLLYIGAVYSVVWLPGMLWAAYDLHQERRNLRKLGDQASHGDD